MLIKYFKITYLVETFLTNAKLIALLQSLLLAFAHTYYYLVLLL